MGYAFSVWMQTSRHTHACCCENIHVYWFPVCMCESFDLIFLISSSPYSPCITVMFVDSMLSNNFHCCISFLLFFMFTDTEPIWAVRDRFSYISIDPGY